MTGSGDGDSTLDMHDEATDARKKRVVLWIDEMNSDFLHALHSEGIEVVALIQASHSAIPSFTVHDMFYGGSKLSSMAKVIAPAKWLDDNSYRNYARCVQRIGFYPCSDYFETVSSGVTLSPDLEDWARVHLNNALQVLEGVAAEEVWFCFTPHLGVDNMMALAALRSGRKCLVFTQIKFATKFSWKQLGVEAAPRAPGLKWNAWRGGAAQPNLFYMRENDTVPWNRNIKQRLQFLMQRLARADWASVSSRLYLASRKRRWWSLMYWLELLDGRTRPWAANRFHFRRKFDRDMAQRKQMGPSDVTGDFVYFPLHLEPEENVHALGGDYRNQLDAVVALHERLPENWTLVLKENPKQTFLHRGQPFDLRLAALSKVRFAGQDVASSSLITQSRLVASITGTAGYEALLAGKPCIYFGEAWYAGLPGAVCFQPDIDLLALSAQHLPVDLLDEAVNLLLSGLPDGLAHPRFAGIHSSTHDVAVLYRQAARSMSIISAAIVNGYDSVPCVATPRGD